MTETFLGFFGIVDNYTILNTPIGKSHFILYQHKETDRDLKWFSKLTNTPFAKDPFEIDGQLVSSRSHVDKVFFIGDSGTFGVGVSRDETFVSLVRKEVNSPNNNPKFQIINAGVVGATPPDTLWLFEKFLIPLKPKVVVYTVFLANDINQSLSDFDFDKFSYNETLSNFNLYKLIYLNSLKYKFHFKKIDEFMSKPWENSRDELGLDIMDFFEGEVASYHRPPTKAYLKAQSNFFSILLKFKKKCEDNGIKFAVTLIPTRSFMVDQLDIQPIDFDLKDKLRKKNIWDHLNLDYNKSRNDLVNFLQANNFTFTDPSGVLKKELGEKSFSSNDDHLSFEGHKILSNNLLRLNYLWK